MAAALAIASVVAIGATIWLLARGDGSSLATPNKTNAVLASQEDLQRLAAELKQPIYWAGPSPNETYELTRTSNGSVYIRYLPKDVDIGDPRPRFTTVGTYPSPTAYADLESGAKPKDTTVFRFPSGALAVTYSSAPSSVFFAFPNSPYTVEVFDRSPARARALVRSSKITIIS